MILLGLFGVAILVVVLVVALQSRSGGDGSTETVEHDDPVLKQLRADNPHLDVVKRLKDDFDRVPVYWAKEKSSGKLAMIPRSLAEGGASIAFATCDPAQIPARLRMTGGSEPVCVRIINDGVTLSAFYYTVPTRMVEMVNHYDGPPTGAARRLGKWQEESRREGPLPDGTRGFLYSYYLYETAVDREWRMLALVGYKRERK